MVLDDESAAPGRTSLSLFLFQKLTSVLHRLAVACMWFAGFGLVVMVVVVGWQVFGRYVLNDSPGWTEPAVLQMMSWFILLGAAVGVRHDDHLGFDLGLLMAPPGMRRVMRFINMVIVGACGTMLVWHGWALVELTWADKLSGLPLPVGINYVPVVIGGVLITLFALHRCIRQILSAEED